MPVFDAAEYNRRVLAASHAMRHAIAGEDDQAGDILTVMTVGPDQGAAQWERLATAVYTWVQMCRAAGHQIGADLYALFPPTPRTCRPR